MTFPFLSSEEFDERAHQLYDAGEYAEALDLLREGLKRFPESADLHVGLGYVRLAREEFAWARQSFSTALRIDPEHEDAWVGMGEVLLKFGQIDGALDCFAQVDRLGLTDDLELGLSMGRALYREALYAHSRSRLEPLAALHPEAAELRAALGYTFHALDRYEDALRELRAALRLDPALHEVRIYVSHMLFERGDLIRALRELDRVPPAEHWDTLSVWRYLELKVSVEGIDEHDAALEPWRRRLRELRSEPDAIDHLLAEVEATVDQRTNGGGVLPQVAPTQLLTSLLALGSGPRLDEDVHRVRTADGALFTGTWLEILEHMRTALAEADEPLDAFMRRTADRVKDLTGCSLPLDDPEAFLRESARIGLLHIEE